MRWFGLSLVAKHKYNERFARRYRNEPSPEFSPTLPCSSIIHILLGPDTSLTQTTFKITGGCRCMRACVSVCDEKH